MENLRLYYKYSLIILIPLLLNACTNTYWGLIENNTNNVINVKLTFINEYGTRFLELKPVKSKESGAWYYEQSSFIITKIDKNLSMVEATNNKGCTISFNRTAIDKNVENHRQKIVIKTQDFIDACGE